MGEKHRHQGIGVKTQTFSRDFPLSLSAIIHFKQREEERKEESHCPKLYKLAITYWFRVCGHHRCWKGRSVYLIGQKPRAAERQTHTHISLACCLTFVEKVMFLRVLDRSRGNREVLSARLKEPFVTRDVFIQVNVYFRTSLERVPLQVSEKSKPRAFSCHVASN